MKKHNIQAIPHIVNKFDKIVVLGKDTTNKLDQTNVVYEFSCKDCSAHYIGETKRVLKKRMSEHSRNKNEELVVNIHRNIFNHEFDFESVKIKDVEQNYHKRLVSEMLFINSTPNSINKYEDTQNLSREY